MQRRGSGELFWHRVTLARIQGQVYNVLHSASSRRFIPEQNANRILALTNALDVWNTQLPLHFRGSSILQLNSPAALQNLCMLYAERLMCRALINYSSGTDTFHYSNWMAEVRDYGFAVTARRPSPSIPLTPGWQTITEEAREFMTLFAAISPKDHFVQS